VIVDLFVSDTRTFKWALRRTFST